MDSTDFQGFSKKLDENRQYTEEGVEIWMARDLQVLLGYDSWQNFEAVIERAKEACASSGAEPSNWFSDTTEPIRSGKGGLQLRKNVYLTRFACYLVAMNGDASKPEIGMAQAYFAIQTRRQEKFDELTEAEKRIELRDRVRGNVKHLQEAAQTAGVKDYPSFHAAGYRGLYGGLNIGEIKLKKDIPAKESILDRAGRAELAANDFRITQAEQQLAGVKGEAVANKVHHEVGKEVRDAIKRIGGTMPEDLPAEPHIKHLIKEQKNREKQLLKEGNSEE